MRVLITTDTVGGVWTFTQEVAAGLLERNCRVLLVSFGRVPSAAQQEQCDALQRKFGASFRYVPSDIPLEWMDTNERAFEDGAELLEQQCALFAPDVIHSNQFCYGALETVTPRLITAHSDVLSWAKACRKEPLAHSPWLKSYVAQVQAGLSRAEAVIAPTQWMMTALKESFGVPECQAVIRNARAVKTKFSGSRVLQAVTAGRLWDEAKGISILQDVKSAVPILVAGESQLDSARRAHLVGSARLIGQLSEAEMLDLLQRSAIYLCLSIYEPFGLAALEAGRCGCAVIARSIPSLREVWGEGALFFKDADSLSVLLEDLARHPQKLEDARRRSYERARSFSRDRMVEEYLCLFERVQSKSARVEHVA